MKRNGFQTENVQIKDRNDNISFSSGILYLKIHKSLISQEIRTGT